MSAHVEATTRGGLSAVTRTRGVVYVAVGAAAMRAASDSIKSLHRVGHAWPVHVIGNDKTEGKEDRATAPAALTYDYVAASGWGARFAKLAIDFRSPFDDTLYLDADTLLMADPSAYFAPLDDGFDLVITPSMNQGLELLSNVDAADRDEACALYDTRDVLGLQAGAFAFRKSRQVHRFFVEWREQWYHYERQDQGALLRALYHAPLRVWLLGRPFNAPRSSVDARTVVEHCFGALR